METFKKIEFENFKCLPISTITVMVESNVHFNLDKLTKIILSSTNSEFEEGDDFSRDAFESTKSCLKQLNMMSIKDFKGLKFPDGTISFIQCNGEKFGKIRKRYKKKTGKNDFRNQVTLDIFVNDNKRINMMIFKNGKFKIAGCKNTNNAISAVLHIWKYVEFLKRKNSMDDDIFKMIDEHPPFFKFTNEMINTSVSFSFTMNKNMINQSFKKEKEFKVFFEQTGQQYVNVKITEEDLEHKKIGIVVYFDEGKIRIDKFETPFKKEARTCFMFFPKRVIISGTDFTIMEIHYNKAIPIIEKNKDTIILAETF